MIELLLPGSDEAIRHGCTCPVLDNDHGRGAYFLNGQAMYIYNESCPVHGVPEEAKNRVWEDSQGL